MQLAKKLLAMVIIPFIFLQNMVHGGIVNKTHLDRSLIVRHNSLEVSTKIHPTSPSELSVNPKQLSNINSISLKSPVEFAKINRHGKLFSDLSFLSGLGIGSLATSGLISTGTKIASGMGMSVKPSYSDFIQQLSSGAQYSIQNSPINNNSSSPNFDVIPSTTNKLLNQALKSMQEILGQLKSKLDHKVISDLQIPSSSVMINRKPSKLLSEGLISSDDTSEIQSTKRTNQQSGLINCTDLKQIIRETIKEHNAQDEKRQAVPLMSTIAAVPTQSSAPATSAGDNSTTPLPPTSSPNSTSNVTTPHSYYYGGHPQNISGINLGYPLPAYGLPTSIPNIYGPPPVYSPVSYLNPLHHHDYYHQDIIDEYPPPDNSLSNSISSTSDQYQIYPPFYTSRKFSDINNPKLIISKNGFIPTDTIV